MPEYTSESIKVLSSIDHVKLRRGMYIGDSSTDARQLLSEIIDNAIDEVQAGFSDELIIYVDTKENRYTVRDFGRGIPHGKKKLANGEEKEVLEVLLTVANSGGKFDNTSYHHSCFTGDTRVKLADGRDITFEELSHEFAEGKDNYCYTVDTKGRISVEKIVFSGITRNTNELVCVTLDSGEQIHCTADHRFLTRDGFFVNAEDLKPGMSLMHGRLGHTNDCFVGYDAIWDNNLNKYVLCVEHISIDTPVDVYDLTVSGDNHTFLLSSGVFVHNCGLNGLGITITNALSKEITITSFRNGSYVKATAHSSDNVDLEYGDSAELGGTNVTFIPDEQYFAKKHIDIKFIEDRCKVASALGFRARLIVDGTELKTDASIYDLITEEQLSLSDYAKIEPIEVISLNGEKMKVALKYTSDTSDRYFGYTNLLSNYLGGTHVQELSKTVIQTWKEFIDKHKNIKPTVELKPNDYLVGLRAVCAVFISKPEFSSQTKEKLVVNKKYLEDLMMLFKNKFYKYLEDNSLIAQQLIKRFEEYRIAQNTLLSRKEISSLIKINTDSSDNIRRRSVVSKLVECTSKKRKDTELFIVEGDSARGPFLFTRNIETQAVLPLRGKILNVTNKSVKDAVKNNEICDLANAMGCGIGGSCDANKSRYDRVIIAADADIDGAQISCLILSVFINMFPDMVKEGRVYIAMPPLYSWGDSPKNFGWCNKIEDVPKGVQFTRFKGLGEMSDDQLKYFLVDPETRNTMQVQYPSDVDAFNRILGTSEGKRELLTNLGVIVKEDN